MAEENRRRNRRRLRELRRDPTAGKSRYATEEERLREDFEYWAFRCAMVKDKNTARRVPLRLNRAQRKVLAAMETQRKAGKPIRLIVLKSRQWGCSTLILHYFLWLQTQRHENWHSLLCCHQKSASMVLSGQVEDIVRYCPESVERPSLKSYQGLRCVRELLPSNSRLTICTAKNPDAARGADYMMAHLSEVSFWPRQGRNEASELTRSVCSSIPRVAESAIVMESTADGPGNYFHREWLRAKDGLSDKAAVFATWHEVDYNAEPLPDSPEETWRLLTDYEQRLWNEPYKLCLEQIWWYHNQVLTQGNRQAVRREYPTTEAEAFSQTNAMVFPEEWIERLRAGVSAPLGLFEVDSKGHRLVSSPSGRLEVWQLPVPPQQVKVRPAYMVAVDVGGTWQGADWSVIAVFNVQTLGKLELVAQWRGHCEIDRLTEMATALGEIYHRALVIFESNTLETRGVHALEKLGRSRYPNLYRRQSLDTVTNTYSSRIGFHTNAATKASAIFELGYLMRDGLLIERSQRAVEEYMTYLRIGQKTEAAHGCHDDMVMTRAIAAYALSQQPPRPRDKF